MTLMTFAGMPQPEPASAKVALIPAPMEKTVCYGHGTSLGPGALIMASSQMELYDELLDCEPYELGFLTLPSVDMHGTEEQALERLEKVVSEQLDQERLCAVIGGEHTVTLGALRALTKKRGTDFTVLVLDAHLDLRESYQNTPYSHACVMKRALDLGLEVRHLASRSCSKEEVDLVREKGLKPMWAHEIRKHPQTWIERYLKDIKGPVYISMDLDGLDPSCLPATGTPEPGGLYWHEVSQWLCEVAKRHEIIGLDVVELAPMKGQAISDFTAARLLYRACGLALGLTPSQGD